MKWPNSPTFFPSLRQVAAGGAVYLVPPQSEAVLILMRAKTNTVKYVKYVGLGMVAVESENLKKIALEMSSFQSKPVFFSGGTSWYSWWRRSSYSSEMVENHFSSQVIRYVLTHQNPSAIDCPIVLCFLFWDGDVTLRSPPLPIILLWMTVGS